MMELGAVSEPFEAGLASLRNGDPSPRTRDCPTTSSTFDGRIRTASGRVISSGASITANKSSAMVPTVPQLAQLFEHSFDIRVRPNR